MRTVLILLLSTGCMRYIPMAPPQRCALRGMVLDGVSMGSSRGYAAGGNGTWAVSRGYSEFVSCARATTKEQRCEIASWSAMTEIEAQYGPVGPDIALFVGYSLFILPGIALYVLFDGQRDDVMKQAADAAKQTFRDCIGGGE